MSTEDYLQELQVSCLEVIRKQNLQLNQFLCTSIFNEKYYNLTKNQNVQDHLNYDIGRILLYPLGLQEVNTLPAVTLIPAVFYFTRGMKLDINQIIKFDPETRWDILLTGFAYRINNQLSYYEENLIQFRQTLERESQQSIGMDLEKAKIYIEQQLATQAIVKQLYGLFLEDTQHLIENQSVIGILKYKDFLAKQKLLIINNINDCIIPSPDIEKTIEFQRFRVAIAFLKKDYDQKVVNRYFDHIEAGLFIFSLIQLDKQQFQKFFCSLTMNQQEQLINRVQMTVENDETAFNRLLLVGKCLLKLRFWKDSLKIFNLLISKIKNYPKYEKFSIYIQFQISKIMLLTGQTSGLIKKFKSLVEIIEKNGIQNIYQNEKSLYHQCLFFQLLLSAYENKTDSLKSVQIKISNLKIYAQQGFSFLQIQFIKLICSVGKVFQDKRGEKQLDCTLKTLSDPSLNNLFEAAQELLIINVLLQHRDIYVLQYLNPKYFSPLKRMINHFQASTQAYIYFFLHEFDTALIIATGLQDYRLLAQIYEQQGRYNGAIEFYRKVYSPNSQFSCAMINKIKGQYKEAYECFAQLQLQSYYRAISKCFRFELGKLLNLQEFLEGLFHNYLRQQESQNYRQSRLSSNVASNFDRKDSQSFYTESKFPGSFNQASGLSKSIVLSAKQSMSQDLQTDVQMMQFDFLIRRDIEFFYRNLVEDLGCNFHSLLTTLNDFLEKTKIYTIESNVLFAENNKLLELIAQGGQSQVYRFEYLGEQYAAKVIEISYNCDVSKVTKADLNLIENKLKEINILCGVSQSKIKYVLELKHIGFKFKMQGQQKIYKIYLLTQLHQQSLIIQSQDIDFKTKFMFKVALALFTLQNQLKILHLDLKPANILVNSKNGTPVLIDFGLSRLFTHSISEYLGEQQMTLAYADPELDQRSRKNDVYSFGVSVYQYTTNEMPFKDCSNFSMIIEVKRFAEYHQKYIQAINSEFLRNLIQDCTKPLKERISFLEVIQRFFKYLYKKQELLIDLLLYQIINIIQGYDFFNIQSFQGIRKIKSGILPIHLAFEIIF